MRRSQSSSSSRVVIAGYYGAGNTGDEAILASLLAMLRVEGITDVTVLSFDPVATRQMHGVNSLSIGRRLRGIFPLLRCVAGANLFVLGGGGIIHDHSQRVVAFWMSRVLLAMSVGTPVVYLGIGVGPLATRMARWLVGTVSRRVRDITVRDPESRRCLQDCGLPTTAIEVTADLALCLPWKSFPRRHAGVNVERRQLSIAVCLRPWDPVGTFAPALAQFLAGARRGRDIRFVFLPFQEREDQQISKDILDRLALNNTGPAARLLRQGSPMEMADLLSDMDAVIAMRLHALILGARLGLPVFGIAYDPKVRHFMERGSVGADCVTLEEVCIRPEELSARLNAWIDGWAAQQELLGSAIDGLVRDAQRNSTLIRRIVNRPLGRSEGI